MTLFAKSRLKTVLLTLVWVCASIYAGKLLWTSASGNKGFSPEQPVRFSHLTHAGKFNIKCVYCHTDAERGAIASPPPLKNCMTCHIGIQTKKELTAPLLSAYEAGTPVKWVRVNRIPDFAKFSHRSHVTAGMDCSSCHGEVEKDERSKQFAEFTMSWCLDCHRNPSDKIIAPRDISGIFTSEMYCLNPPEHTEPSPVIPEYGEFERKTIGGNNFGIPTPRKFGRGPENCSACHY